MQSLLKQPAQMKAETVADPMPARNPSLSPGRSLQLHWKEYLMEAAGLGLFMVSACLFGALYEFPASPVHKAIASAFLRRVLMGLTMGLTAVAIIFSPWGKQSGAHINPAVTLTFFRLGKVVKWDAVFYIVAQFTGGFLGVVFAALLFRPAVSHPAVEYVVTLPGPGGVWIALGAESAISFVLMSVVLQVSNHPRIGSYTGVFAGALVALFIAFEAPLSGMSMNPARTMASALPAGVFDSLWIYFTAPPLGMLLAAEVYLWWKGKRAVKCCKYHHDNLKRCIFCGANGGFVS